MPSAAPGGLPPAVKMSNLRSLGTLEGGVVDTLNPMSWTAALACTPCASCASEKTSHGMRTYGRSRGPSGAFARASSERSAPTMVARAGLNSQQNTSTVSELNVIGFEKSGDAIVIGPRGHGTA